MSEYTFKNLNEIDNVSEPADSTTVMGFENGTPIQMPMSAIKGTGGGVFIINPSDADYSTTDTAQGNKIKEALLSGKVVWMYLNNDDYSLVLAFDVSYKTNGVRKLRVWPSVHPSTNGFQDNPHLQYDVEFSITDQGD